MFEVNVVDTKNNLLVNVVNLDELSKWSLINIHLFERKVY